MQTIIITENDSGQRFDKYLKRYFQGATGGFLYKMLRKKNIVLNGKKAGGNELLSAGDRVGVFFSDETFLKMKGDTGPAAGVEVGKATSFAGEGQKGGAGFETLSTVPREHVAIVYEDDRILVANKPAGILSQKERADEVSLNEELLSYLIKKGEVTEESYRMFHPSVSNRLDRNTTGLVLFGKTLPGQKYLSEVIRDRSAKKIYHTVVHGKVSEELLLTAYLRKDPGTNRAMILAKPESERDRFIKTGVTPLLWSDEYSLLSVELFTGRPHQIRAHLSSVGHPVVFDPKYGDPVRDRRLKKECGPCTQLLHAYSITLPEGREFVAEEPEFFQDFWRGRMQRSASKDADFGK